MHGQTKKKNPRRLFDQYLKTHMRMQISPHCPVGLSRDVGKWSNAPPSPPPPPPRWRSPYSCVPSRPVWVCSLRGAAGVKQCLYGSHCSPALGAYQNPHVQHPKYHYSTQPATSTCAYLPSRQRGEVLTGISSRFRTPSANQSSIFLFLCRNNAEIPRCCPAGDWSKYS